MWTRLVAGAAAHEISNLAQGLSNLLSLASGAGATREDLEGYAALALDGIRELRELATHLRALAAIEGKPETQRLDLVTLEAVSDLGGSLDRAIDVSPLDARALVSAPAAALRLAIRSVVRYSVAASPPKAGVSVRVSRHDGVAAVFVAAPSAPPPRSGVEAELATLLAGPEREFGGDAGLILAGAATHLLGGRTSAGPAPGGGLRFTLSLPAVEEAPHDADSA
jgi:signal transduction histidine kinase